MCPRLPGEGKLNQDTAALKHLRLVHNWNKQHLETQR